MAEYDSALDDSAVGWASLKPRGPQLRVPSGVIRVSAGG
jgi:hypothetical protein